MSNGKYNRLRRDRKQDCPKVLALSWINVNIFVQNVRKGWLELLWQDVVNISIDDGENCKFWKGQYGDEDLFVDCKEGDSIEWILPLAVTYIGREDAEKSICVRLTLLDSRKNIEIEHNMKRHYLYWAGECREHRAFQCCPRFQTCEMCTWSSWSTIWKWAWSITWPW